jgi:integrase
LIVAIFNHLQLRLNRQILGISDVLDGIRRQHSRPPVKKLAIKADEVLGMVATLPHDLGGLRDRAILLLAFAGGLRRSEVVGLDFGPDQTEDATGWVEFHLQGVLVRTKVKAGWRDVPSGPGSRDTSCPVYALKTWLQFARIAHGPLFRRVIDHGKQVGRDRLSDKHVARVIQNTADAAGIRPDLTGAQRRLAFGGHSLRSGLASASCADPVAVQRQLGHANINTTIGYIQLEERFRFNFTKAAGL